MSCHAEFLRVALDGDDRISRAVFEDAAALDALCTPRQAALVELVRIVTRAPWELSRAHLARAHAADLDDDAVLHAVLQAAYFGHLNRIADATGVPLDYVVAIPGIPADPSTPALAAAPRLVTRPATIELARRASTAAALAEWRAYVMEKDAPLSPSQRVRISAWVAGWLGDGSVPPPEAVAPVDAELRALAELVTLAPWQLAADSYAPLRSHGFDDAALFDVCATASTAGMFSRITVALAALAT